MITSQIHLSNLISIIANKFYNVDMTTSLTISSLLISIISMIEFNLNLLYLLIPGLFIGCLYYFKNINIFNKNFYTLSVYDTNIITDFLWYMKEYPDFFDKNYNLDFGNTEYLRPGEWVYYPSFLPQNGTDITIKDTLFGITGYIKVKIVNYIYGYDKENRPQKRDRIYFQINISSLPRSSDNKSDINYIEFIQKHRQEKTLTITLYGIKYFPSTTEDYPYRTSYSTLYEGKPMSDKERYNKYLASYFSPVKNEIWKRIEQIHYNPESILNLGQIPNFNILAYGPPGSGKSTFAYRIAMALNRHLISIDLSTLCDLPLYTIYSLIISPTRCGLTYSSNQCVIILEEFDRAIFTLNQRQKKRDLLICPPWMMKEEFMQDKEEKKKGKDKKEDEEGRTKNFDLGDLLELLQGPIPNSGSIIIATTNHYEKIKEILPALFRPGRLTPIKFDYLDYTTLQELSMFYFQKELTIPKIDNINIPTSKIIDLSIRYKLANDFDSFQKELESLVVTHLG